MGKTRQISVTNASPTAVTIFAEGAANIRVTENLGVVGAPTTDFLILKPSSADVPVRIQRGAHYTFSVDKNRFGAGATVGYIQTVAGTTTFDVDEDSP